MAVDAQVVVRGGRSAARGHAHLDEEEVRVECFCRVENGQGWYYQVFESLGARILFKKLGMEINLKDIYQGIEIAR